VVGFLFRFEFGNSAVRRSRAKLNSVPSLIEIFQEEYRELRPRADMPVFTVEFFRFVNVNNNIRLRDGQVRARLSDLLEGAPEAVLRSIAHILLAKLYRKPIEPYHAARYRRYVGSHDLQRKVHLIRQARGRKRISTAQGHVYDLDAIFDDLNTRFFHGLLGRPQMTWSQERARHMLGHFDPAHNTIVISRVFDQAGVPRCVVEYIVYHEMLHLKHPVKLRGTRRCVHGPAFQAEEKLFPHLDEAKRFLKRM
jgi:hypothetical protein